MKVGTDGVLVGAWAGLSPDDRHILDIGTGTGLIALMLAQRTENFGTRNSSDPLSAAHDTYAARQRQPSDTEARPTACAEALQTPDSPASQTAQPDCPTETPASQATLPDSPTKNPASQPARPDSPSDAKACGARITGIDIGDIDEARANADASPWGDRVEFVRCPVQTFRPDRRYDLIVSNPPFFVDSLTSPDAGRTTARHTVELPFEELRDAVVRLLAEDGRFAVVLPVEEGRRFERICRGRLFAIRRTEVRTTPRKAPKRLLLEFALRAPGREIPTGELTIGTGAHETYTPEYRALTGDFYLKF